MDSKKVIRKHMIELRATLSDIEINEKSRLIFKRLTGQPEYGKSCLIMCYIDFGKEVRTKEFIKICLESGKRVAVPVIVRRDEEKEIIASEISTIDAGLEMNSFGILEPAKDIIKPVDPKEIDLAVVPGVAFDVERNRLGYGGGFYDRFMRKLKPACSKIAVAFEIQISDNIPLEEHDMPIDMIVTEDRVISDQEADVIE